MQIELLEHITTRIRKTVTGASWLPDGKKMMGAAIVLSFIIII